MALSSAEKNLLIFLDPASLWGDNAWCFVRRGVPPGSSGCADGGGEGRKNKICCYQRHDLFRYAIHALFSRFEKRRGKVRHVLFLDDGLLSCFLDADRAAGYRAYARRHLPPPKGIRQRLRILLPPVLRAEQRFIVFMEQNAERTHNDMGRHDFMFYSNEEAKLMLTMADTFLNGKGQILKCAASPRYAANLEHEHATVRTIAGRLACPAGLPCIGDVITVNGRRFFPEDYLCGDSLRERLRLLGRAGDTGGACRMLDMLDGWYAEYHAAFTGPRLALTELYARPLRLFAELTARDARLAVLITRMREFLAGQDKSHGGVVPVTAHNDLWPGNFIVSGDRLLAVDWERATEQSAPLFDYYWMIISAVLEYRVGNNGSQDYAFAFRQFLDRGDDVCRHAHAKLGDFLAGLGLGGEGGRAFLALFLMEWSIQGFQALGEQTDMDRLALGELMSLVGQGVEESPLDSSPLPAIVANMVP